jgi:hypothetical protein
MDFDSLIKIGKEINDENTKPSVKELEKYKKVVFDFIKRKKRLLYGGLAMHFILETEKYEKKLYDSDREYDYDFYTPDPIADSIELSNELYDKGFPFVKRIVGISGVVFRIQVNTNTDIADINYCPQRVYDIIPRYDANNGVVCVHPDFLRIDFYKSLLHTPHSMWRWLKDYERLQIFEKLFPIKTFRFGGENNYKSDDLVPRTLLDKVLADIVLTNKESIVLTGTHAYNYYIGLVPRGTNKVGGANKDDYSGELVKTTPDDISFIARNSDEIKESLKTLIDKYVSGVKYSTSSFTFIDYSPLMKMIGKSFIVTFKGRPIIRVVEPAQQVVPYITIKMGNSATCRIHDYYGLLQYYHILKFIDPENDKEYTGRIVDIKIASQKYTAKKPHLTATDPKNPFQIMIIKGMETNAITTKSSLRFSGKKLALYMPENGKEEINTDAFKKYYETEIDPYYSGAVKQPLVITSGKSTIPTLYISPKLEDYKNIMVFAKNFEKKGHFKLIDTYDNADIVLKVKFSKEYVDEMKNVKLINGFINTQELSSKNGLLKTVLSWTKENGINHNLIIPKTVTHKIGDDVSLVIKEFKNVKYVIIKPVYSYGGAGIVLSKTSKLSETLGKLKIGKEYIIQEYITDTMTIPHKTKGYPCKFDLRVNLLMNNDHKFIQYKPILVRVSDNEYTPNDITNPLTHITNMALRKTSTDNSGRLLSEVQELKGYENKINEFIKKYIKPLINSTMKPVNDIKSFQRFGLDLLIKSDGTILLLEINENPGNMKSTHDDEMLINWNFWVMDVGIQPTKEELNDFIIDDGFIKYV